MRFLKIARRPAWYSRALYARQPEMAEATFEQQHRWYCRDFFGPVDTWQTYLPRIGFEARDLICGVPEIDRAWWREYGSGEEPASLVSHQIKHYRPEILFLEGIEAFSRDEIASFRDQLPAGTPVAGLTGTDIRSNPSLRAVDVVFTCMKGLAAELKAEGRAAHFLPHSFDPRILAMLSTPRIINEPLNFIGNLASGQHMHDSRRKVVEAVAAATGIVIYSNIERSLPKAALRYAATTTAYATARLLASVGVRSERMPHPKLATASRWKERPAFGFDRALARDARPGAYGLGQYDLLRRGRATLNIHAGLAENYAANMRLYEATGAGTCLLTDSSRDIREFFEPDSEVLTFSSIDEAVEKARFIVENPVAADEIAKAGHTRTLRSHTFEQRMPILRDALRQWMSQGRAA